jgi:hypothetical protein
LRFLVDGRDDGDESGTSTSDDMGTSADLRRAFLFERAMVDGGRRRARNSRDVFTAEVVESRAGS